MLSVGPSRPEYLRLCRHFNCALGGSLKTPLPHSSAGDLTLRLVLFISQRDYLFRSNSAGFIILLRILDTRLPTPHPTWVPSPGGLLSRMDVIQQWRLGDLLNKGA